VGTICTDNISSPDNLPILKCDVGDASILLVPLHANYLVWTLYLNPKVPQLLREHKLSHVLRDEKCVRVDSMILQRVEHSLNNLRGTRCHSEAIALDATRYQVICCIDTSQSLRSGGRQ